MNEHKSKETCLTVKGFDSKEEVEIKEVYSVPSLPVQPNKTLTARELKTWPHLIRLHIPSVASFV